MARSSSLLDEIENDVLTSRPVADALRKCVILGGKAGSVELREWATRELRGYDSKDDAPDYRTVGAPLFADAVTGNAIVKRQQIGVSSLPDFVQEEVSDQFTLLQGIGAIEAMASSADSSEKGAVDLSLPMASEIGSMMDQASGNRFQQITALYWSVSAVALHSVIDQVRTTLTELVAEMRAGTPATSDLPSAEVASQAVNVAVNGKRARVTVQTAQAGNGSSANLDAGSDTQSSPFWTASRRLAAFIAGVASIVGVGIAVAQIKGWL